MDYLNQKDPPLGSIIKNVDLINIYKFMQRDLDNVLAYYRKRDFRVGSSHFLSKIIKSFLPNIKEDIYTYIFNIDRMYDGVLKHYNIASPVSNGKIQSGSVYHNTSEMFLSTMLLDNYFDINDWENLSPLRPILLDTNDIFMPHPEDGVYDGSLVVFELDIKLMMVMYYHWSKMRLSYERDIDPSTFVYQYVLTNAIPNALDLAIWNVFQHGEIYKHGDTHPFAISDLRKKLQASSRKFKKKLKSKKADYTTLMHSIELVGNSNLYELFRNRNSIFTSNNLPTYVISRSDLYLFLLMFYKTDSREKNGAFVRRMGEQVNRTINYHKDLGLEVQLILETLQSTIGDKGE